MEIYGKRALRIDQLNAGIQKGMNKIEIQLLDELFDENQHCLKAKKVFDLDEMAKYDIRVVHAPLIKGEDINIEHMTFGEYSKLLNEICYLANYIAEKRNRDVIIVVHTAKSIQELRRLGDNWNQLVVTVGLMLSKYPRIEFAIENVIPFTYTPENRIIMKNNFNCDNVAMAKALNELLDTDRVGTVLDTCHIQITQKYIKAIFDALNDNINMPMEDLSFEHYFIENAAICKLIHLATMTDNGLSPGTHGTPYRAYDKEEMDRLAHIISLYKKYRYACPITLEVLETDFLNPQNYLKAKESLLSLI